jgi:hypothetical protein
MNEKHDMKQVFDLHLSSLRFQAASRKTVLEKALGKEEPVVKRKTSVALVFALVLTLLAVTALAAVAVLHSDNANKVNLAREALYQKYGLTPETLGMFPYEGSEVNGTYTLTWTCNTYNASLTGTYITIVKDGVATASWSYDNVDPSVYDSEALSAPIWGHLQLEAALKNPEVAGEYSRALDRLDRENKTNETPGHVSEPLADGERFWQNEILHEAQPGANDLTAEKAYEIAVQAFVEDFGIDREVLIAGALQDETFLLRENGRSVWDIGIYVMLNGVESDCVVRLDGETGEVLSIDVLTGGNG